MATLTFENYFFENYSFSENRKFDSDTKSLEVEIFPHADIHVGKENVLIRLKCDIGDYKNVNCPFVANVSMIATFKHSVDENDADDKLLSYKMVSQNTLAIIFPYLRSFVSEMTLKSNKFPAYVMPTMNFVQLLEDTDSVNIIEVKDEEAE